MAVKSALTGTNLTNLAGPHTNRWHVSVVNNSTKVATARINQATFTYPLAVLTVDTINADWGLVDAGFTVAIGSTAGAADKGLYRARRTGNSTTLYIGETSEGDPGLITQSIRNAALADNDYITVYLYRFDIWSVIPRIIASTGTIYEDYDSASGTNNTTPQPIVNVTIDGTTDRWAGYSDSGQTYRTVTLAASGVYWPSASSISSYQWFLPASWTVTGGSTLTNTVTAQVPQSTENYSVYVSVADNTGAATAAFRQVWAHARTGATAPLSFVEGAIQWDRTGMRATLTLNNADLASIPKGAMVHIWQEALWNGADIAGATTGFTGWVVRQTENTEQGLRSAEIEIVGPCGLLEKLGSYSQHFDQAGSPATWQQLLPSLMYVDFLIWWILRQRASGVLQLFNYTKIGHANTTGRLPAWRIESAGNLLEQCRTLAQAYSANFGANPDGEIMVRYHPNLIAYGSRGSITTRGTLTESRYLRLTLNRELKPRTRKTRGEGFYWDGVATLPTPFLSDAPGDAPGQGTGEEGLQRQVVDSQSDLNTRTGLYFAHANNPLSDISIEAPGNWGVFFPAEMQFLALTAAAAYRPDNAALSINTIPTSVALRLNEDGTVDTSINAEGETSGVAGVTVPVPSQATSNTRYTRLPSRSTTSVGGITGVTKEGGTVIAANSTKIAITVNWLGTATTIWVDITGTGLTGNILDVHFDPFSERLGASNSGALALYVATTTGIFYCSNILVTAGSAVFTQKLALTMATCVLRTPIWASGTVYIHYLPTNPGQPTTKKLTANGATTAWTQTVGSNASVGAFVGMDISQQGNDVVLASGDVGTTSYVYKITNGGTPSQLAGTAFASSGANPAGIGFIQLPLLTLSGTPNSSDQFFVFAGNQQDGTITPRAFYKTTNQGTSITDISPQVAGVNQTPANASSIAFTTDANIMAFSTNDTGRIFTTTNGGSTWNNTGNTGYDYTSGFFPRTQSGSYGLYLGGTSDIAYSANFGVSVTSKKGNWASAVGGSGGYRAALPIY